MRTAILLPLAALFGLAAWQEAKRPPLELELLYLANEGFLLRAGGSELLIDAFVAEPYGGYAALPEELLAAMLAAEPPFDGIELALTSHHHRDHFQPEVAAAFLRAHPETSFVSAPQVTEELRHELGDDPAAERVDALLPEARAKLAAGSATLGVELLRLPHSGGARTASVQNLGHVLALGGARILHVGDADGTDAELDAYDVEQHALDVALVPYWWLGDARGIALARERTGAKHLVAVHVPPAEVATVKAHLAALDPAILLFEKPGESKKLVLER